jgi:hypothetical protein
MAVSFSGSLDISGSLTTTGTIVMSGSIASASFATSATTASNANTSSYVVSSQTDATQNTRLTTIEAVTGSFATTGSNQFNGSQIVTGSLTATGTIVAQTLVVQTITSSVDFVTGSTRFGSTTGNTHQFTGSVLVSGSQTINGALTGTSATFSSNVNITAANTLNEGVAASIIRQNGDNGNNGLVVDVTNTPNAYIADFRLANSSVFRIGTTGASTFTNSVTATSFSNAGLLSGEVFNATKSNSGYFVGYFQNTSATGYGLVIQNGSDTLDAIRISNAAGTENPIRLFGNGNAYFSGSVGIGTTSPQAALQVVAPANVNGIRIDANNSYEIFISGNDAANIYHSTANQDLYLNTNGGRLHLGTSAASTLFTISGSNVGIGTTSPGAKLDIVGDARIQGGGSVSYAVLNMLDNTSGGSNWAIFSGYPVLGNFTIRESGVANHLVIAKTTGAATFSNSVAATSFSVGEMLYNSNQIYRNSSNEMYVNYSGTGHTILGNGTGNVGINVGTNPSYRLQVGGTLGVSGAATFSSSATFGSDVFTYNNGGIFFSGAATYTSGIFQNANGLNLQTGGSPKLTVTSAGNVGIGLTNPGAKLHVEVAVESPATGAVALIAKTSNGNNDIFRWFDGATQLGVFKNSGNVGIGLTNPQTQLHLNGVITFTETNLNTVRLNQISSAHSDGNSANNNLRFLVSNGSGTTAERMRINGEGNVGIGKTSPISARLAVNGGPIQIMQDYPGHQTIIRSAGTSGGYSGQLTITIPEMQGAGVSQGFGGYSCEVYVAGFEGAYCHAWFSGYINNGLTASEVTILRSNGGWSISQTVTGTFSQGLIFYLNYPSIVHPTARIIFNKGGDQSIAEYNANSITASFS